MKATSRATFYTDKPAPQRRRYLIESAIVSAALDHRTETEKLVPFGDCTISVWNSHADLIDEEFGKGFLGVRIVRVNAFTFRWQIDNETPGKAGVPIGIWLALGKLDDLADYPLLFWEARQENPALFDWMADLLFMSIIPEGLILREAGPRNSIWHRRLRKRVAVEAQRRAIAHNEQLAELMDDQRRQHVRVYRNDLLRRHRTLERLIRLGRRLDPDLKEVAAGWPHGWRVIGTYPLGNLGMLVPLSWSMAQNAATDELPGTTLDRIDLASEDRAILAEDDPATE